MKDFANFFLRFIFSYVIFSFYMTYDYSMSVAAGFSILGFWLYNKCEVEPANAIIYLISFLGVSYCILVVIQAVTPFEYNYIFNFVTRPI